MPTININGNIITQTAADWALDATVYSNKTILVTSDVFYATTDQPRFKFANGVDVWSALDYVPEGGGGTNTNLIIFSHTNGTNLADNSDYFITSGTTMGNTSNSSVKMPIPAGTLTGYSIVSYVGGTFGTSEAASVSLVWNDGANEELLSNSVMFDARHNKYVGTKSVSVSESYGWVRLDTPVYTTNPTGAKIIILLTFDI